MKTMKTALAAALLLAAASTAARAAAASQTQAGGKLTLTACTITELDNSLPAEVTLIDASTHRAVIEIPDGLADKIVCRIEGSVLTLRAKSGAEKLLRKSEPIKVRIESSSIICIDNTGSMTLTYGNRHLDLMEINNMGQMRWSGNRVQIGTLTINNSGVFVLGVKKFAADCIKMNNAGHYRIEACTFDCEHWEGANSGIADISSRIETGTVEYISSGRDNTSLDVDCKGVEIVSTGVGKITLSGRTDNMDIYSTGLTQISTSGVNQNN